MGAGPENVLTLFFFAAKAKLAQECCVKISLGLSGAPVLTGHGF